MSLSLRQAIDSSDLQQLNALVVDNAAGALKCEIGWFGGRRFRVAGIGGKVEHSGTIALKDIEKRLHEILKVIASNHKEPKDVDMCKNIYARIQTLDKEANDLLATQNCFYRVLTKICQSCGNNDPDHPFDRAANHKAIEELTQKLDAAVQRFVWGLGRAVQVIAQQEVERHKEQKAARAAPAAKEGDAVAPASKSKKAGAGFRNVCFIRIDLDDARQLRDDEIEKQVQAGYEEAVSNPALGTPENSVQFIFENLEEETGEGLQLTERTEKMLLAAVEKWKTIPGVRIVVEISGESITREQIQRLALAIGSKQNLILFAPVNKSPDSEELQEKLRILEEDRALAALCETLQERLEEEQASLPEYDLGPSARLRAEIRKKTEADLAERQAVEARAAAAPAAAPRPAVAVPALPAPGAAARVRRPDTAGPAAAVRA